MKSWRVDGGIVAFETEQMQAMTVQNTVYLAEFGMEMRAMAEVWEDQE